MRKLCLWLILLLWLPCFLWSEVPYAIVFVHIGKTLPAHLEIALAQARLFNRECPIILIANANALQGFCPSSNTTLVSCESLPLTREHEEFRKRSKLNDQFLEGYWRYTSERFLYLHDYMAAFGAKNIFHIENDVLLYVDLEKLLPVFQAYYPGIATTFESEFKCVPGFVYIANEGAVQKLANSFAQKASKAMTDMKLMAQFWKEHKEDIDCLPMIMESYLLDHIPAGIDNRIWRKKLRHCSNIAQFESIFDGAAIGVFFDGLDPAKGDYHPGYLMKGLFNASWIDYKWEMDENGRKVPYAIYGSEIYRINNLHIASKRLERFTSREWPW